MSESWYDIQFVLDRFATLIADHIGDKIENGRVIRDVFGRLSFAPPPGVTDRQLADIRQGVPEELKPFLSSQDFILNSKTPLLKALLAEKGTTFHLRRDRSKFLVLDRRVAGEDWLQQPSSASLQVPRFAFFGLKGGVGRSTALAVSAANFAAHGKNVLVLDLDLEAPGLGSILLSPEKQPEYGVLDWLAAGSVGADLSLMIPDMIGGSPFTTGSGLVDVVPASGTSTSKDPVGFLSKIARAYTPGAASGELRGLNFTQKIQALISSLSERRSYDAILLDVRAGLHETSAASLLGLGAKTFLFGMNSSQTYAGYQVLLANVRQAIESWPDAPDLRSHFRMVHGRATSQSAERSEFRSNCWQLWIDHLYDAVGDDPDPSLVSFDLDDEEGPHFPWTIPHSEIFLTFDPRKDPSHLDKSIYDPVFTEFASKFFTLLDLESSK